ncbi:uncharacterized protein HaLaN_25012 [Haematococcus lacustris]|uniref:Uncharacterized protein n=1 Tax=Haematococcus lacustris TaxID=44745 RepID=A0A6A0A229_HAELA|nr:uncharacterized protein HaLaN_25012 [Haematococcus lacustris]
MSTVQVDAERGILRLSMLSPIPFIKLTEIYHLDSSTSTNRRRDFRPGTQAGRLQVSQNCLKILLDWPAPVPGYAVDELRMTSEDTLVMTSTAHRLPQSGPTGSDAAITPGRVPSATFRSLYRRDPPRQSTWW